MRSHQSFLSSKLNKSNCPPSYHCWTTCLRTRHPLVPQKTSHLSLPHIQAKRLSQYFIYTLPGKIHTSCRCLQLVQGGTGHAASWEITSQCYPLRCRLPSMHPFSLLSPCHAHPHLPIRLAEILFLRWLYIPPLPPSSQGFKVDRAVGWIETSSQYYIKMC